MTELYAGLTIGEVINNHQPFSSPYKYYTTCTNDFCDNQDYPCDILELSKQLQQTRTERDAYKYMFNKIMEWN